jgi:NRPS condensation-like uncharacterized protein
MPGSGAREVRTAPDVRPFSAVEELLTALEKPAEPQTVHLEVLVGSGIELERLRAATLATLAAVPKARARRRPWRWSDRRYVWQSDVELDLDPVTAHVCDSAPEMHRLRDRAISTPIELDRSPPLRVASLQSPTECSVLLVAHHAATDAIGALWLLRTLAAAYGGQAPRAEPLVAATAEAGGRGRGGLASAASLARFLRHATRAPARIAPDHATPTPGFRVHSSSIAAASLRARPSSATLNDVLIAAMHLAIAGWNEEHGNGAGRIRVMLPVNLRPSSDRDRTVGNVWLAVVTATTRRDRSSPASTLAAVVAQSQAAKRRADAASLYRVMGTSSALPLWAKRAIPAVHPLTRHRLEDTAVLSNLGAVPELEFPEAGPTRGLLFSPPARMPKGLSVGAATYGERLWLTYRYRPALFDAAAAERFAAILHRSIEKVCEA